MAKKKTPESSPPSPASNENRQTVQLHREWHLALLRLAGRWRQQKAWALYRIIGEACDAEGIAHPPYPWDEMGEEDSPS